jgi:hypothetical protein
MTEAGFWGFIFRREAGTRLLCGQSPTMLPPGGLIPLTASVAFHREISRNSDGLREYSGLPVLQGWTHPFSDKILS